MKRTLVCSLCFAFLIGLANAPIAAAPSKLEGVWKVDEHPISVGPATVNPQPGLYMFTKKHYSIMYVSSDKPRPDLPPNPTDAQRIAAWEPFTANSGTYEIKGTTITLHPLVAKNPAFMKSGSVGTIEFKLEDNTLWITWTALNDRPVANTPAVKLVRVE